MKLIKEPPHHWIYNSFWKERGANAWKHRLVPLVVMRSISTLSNGDKWLHVSVSRNDRLPSWSEISKIKDEFIGEDEEAYQVLAKKKDHVNLHNFCLHLWSPMDGKSRVANLQDLELEVAI